MFKNKIAVLSVSALLLLCNVGCSNNDKEIQELQNEIKRLEQTIEDTKQEEQKTMEELEDEANKVAREAARQENKTGVVCDLCGDNMHKTTDKALLDNKDIYECKNNACIDKTTEFRLYCANHQKYYFYCDYCEKCMNEFNATYEEPEPEPIMAPHGYCASCDGILDEHGYCAYCGISLYCPTCGGYTNDWGECMNGCQYDEDGNPYD